MSGLFLQREDRERFVNGQERQKGRWFRNRQVRQTDGDWEKDRIDKVDGSNTGRVVGNGSGAT